MIYLIYNRIYLYYKIILIELITNVDPYTTSTNPAWLWTLKVHFNLVNRWIIHQMDVNHKTESPIFSGDLGTSSELFENKFEIQDCDGFWDLDLCWFVPVRVWICKDWYGFMMFVWEWVRLLHLQFTTTNDLRRHFSKQHPRYFIYGSVIISYVFRHSTSTGQQTWFCCQ